MPLAAIHIVQQNRRCQMSRKYDLLDAWKVYELQSDFQFYSSEDWRAFIEFANSDNYCEVFSKSEKDILYLAEQHAGNTQCSNEEMMKALDVADKIKAMKKE
jgi:hypothetical protein